MPRKKKAKAKNTYKNTDTKRSVGRPTLYDPKYCDELIEYFNVEPYSKVKKTMVFYGQPVEVDEIQASDMRTLAGFAVKIGVHTDTLHEWAHGKNDKGELKHPEFAESYRRAKNFQENFLAVNGNKGLLNANFAIFTAKNVLGWRDKQPGEEDQINVNVEAKDLKNKTTEEIKAELKELLERAKGKDGIGL